jgi:thioredoxin:protein disulfide reductase
VLAVQGTDRTPPQSDPAPSASDPAAIEVRQPQDQPSAEISPWTSLESAMDESKRNGKPVMIDFNADWYAPCQQLKQQVFDDGSRGQAVQAAVIPVSIVDRTREDGSNPPDIANLQKRFGVRAFPTLIVFSPETGKIKKAEGFGSADQALQWIIESAKGVR